MRQDVGDWADKGHFLTDGKPAPCMVIRCWRETVVGRCLCAEHELLFVAVTGHVSPSCNTEDDWGRHHANTDWMTERFKQETWGYGRRTD